MTTYLPRLRVRIAHGYYANGQVRGLRLQPSPATREWLRLNDALWRDTGDGLELSAPQAQEAPQAPQALPAALDPMPETLVWLAYSDDPLWANVTAPLPGQRTQLPCLRALQAAQSGGPEMPLQTQASLWPLHPPGSLAWAFEAPSGTQQPALVLTLPAPVLSGAAAGPARYVGSLAARTPLWQYWLVGDWAGSELRVEDVTPANDSTDRVAFEAQGTRQLNTGEPAQLIRSERGIALRERPDYRFQLRGQAGAVDRVLVKRLPLAGADHFARETIEGVPTLVSDIFVHR